jgi:hypothetical protein
MEKFISEFDPLVALEAEYAAVVARTRVQDAGPVDDDAEAKDAGQAEKHEEEPVERDDDDDDASLGEDFYAPLPADSDDEYEEQETEEEDCEAPVVPPVRLSPSPAPPTPMDETTKHAIMTSMQSMQLQPPPWAQNADIPDDELLELVQRRLRNSAQQQQQQ